MRRLVLLSLAALLAVAIAVPVAAEPPERLPFINGGGVSTNQDSGGHTYGGFTARATETTDDPDIYVARGEVQGRATDGENDTVTRIHGDVVCIANLGPADSETGGEPGVDVWEIRFRVEQSNVPQLVGLYGSAFVQDNGRDDYADENFDEGKATNPACGNTDQYQLEDHVHGNITVHD